MSLTYRSTPKLPDQAPLNHHCDRAAATSCLSAATSATSSRSRACCESEGGSLPAMLSSSRCRWSPPRPPTAVRNSRLMPPAHPRSVASVRNATNPNAPIRRTACKASCEYQTRNAVSARRLARKPGQRTPCSTPQSAGQRVLQRRDPMRECSLLRG